MSLLYTCEPFSPPADMLKQVEKMVRLLKDSFHGSDEHFSKYMSAHKQRLCFDYAAVTSELSTGERVLDVGSMPPVLLSLLHGDGYQASGIDIDPSRVKLPEGLVGLPILKCNIETDRLPFDDGAFDVVVLFEIFEHLRIDITHTFSEIRRVLADNGRLLLSTPNLRSAGGIYNFLIKNRAYSCLPGLYAAYESIRTKGHAGHIREYTSTEMIDFINAAGFRVDKVIYRGRYSDNFKQLAVRFFSSLRPYCGYVATKI